MTKNDTEIELDFEHPDAMADPAPGPEEELLRLERIRLIEEEIQRLPGLQRECVNLKARGLRYHEIASSLDISMTTAVDNVRRAVKRIGKRFVD